MIIQPSAIRTEDADRFQLLKSPRPRAYHEQEVKFNGFSVFYRNIELEMSTAEFEARNARLAAKLYAKIRA